jgi:hypothetical protein
MVSASAPVAGERVSRRARRRWWSDAIIAGFVAIGTSTGVLMLAYALANGAADSQGDILRRWLWLLTHNEVVVFSSSRPAVSIALHVILGLIWAIVYARFLEWNPRFSWWLGRGPGWARGMRFSLLPWLVSLLILLPAALFDKLDVAFSAGPLVPLGNLVLHLIYGFTLGQLYDASADEANLGADLVYEEPMQRRAIEHSEDLGATGILFGAVIGAAVGIMLAVVLPPVLPNVDFGGWQVALGVGGILAGGAVGGIVGSFAGLPQTESEEVSEFDLDPFTHRVMPFLLPPFLMIIIAAVIVTMGETLLQFGKTEIEIGSLRVGAAVMAAALGVLLIGVIALIVSLQSGHSPSSRDTVSHRAEH